MKRKLNILIVSRYYKMGGAALAALRLHNSLLENGINSTFISLDENMKDTSNQINLRRHYNHVRNLPARIYKKISKLYFHLIKRERAEIIIELKRLLPMIKAEFVSLPFSDYGLENHPSIKDADIIHLHWVGDEMLDYEKFFRKCNKPVVWTLHDLNPFQGLFHYENDKIINKYYSENLDNQIINIKARAISKFKNQLLIVTPSNWLSQKASESNVFSGRIVVTIPNSLNQSIFCLQQKEKARKTLGLPINSIILLFVAESIKNYRKGFDLLLEALHILDNQEILLVAIGDEKIKVESAYKIVTTGNINNENLLAKYYASADGFILPSREDNLPNVMLEALSCGTPIIGFPVGGIKEHIHPYKTGILANEISAKALSIALKDFINYLPNFDPLYIRKYAVQSFNNKKQLISYLEIYKKLM